MSVPATTGLTAPDAPPSGPVSRRRLPRWWPAAALLLAVVLLSLLRIVTGADDLTSAGTISATLVATVPIMLAGLGGLWSERAGVVNIGLEGMMILGTYGAGYFGYHHGAWAGVVGAIGMGMIGGLVHAVATVVFGVDHVISGVAINIIALGAVQYLASLTFVGLPGGGQTQSPKIPDVTSITIGPLSDGLQGLDEKNWFFVSELAAIVRGLTTNLSVLVVISLLLLVVSWWVLWRTAFGLRLRSCGESPAAAESLGVAVLRYKFVAVLISGGLAGLAGGVLAIVASSNYRDGQTGGRGYIGLAAMIFGNWRPTGLLAGSGLFGYTQTLGLRQGGDSVHALLLAVAVLALALAVVQVRRGHRGAAVFIAVVGLAVGAVYFLIDSVPDDFTTMTPYLITLLVLAFASQRLRMPAADGQIYRKGQCRVSEPVQTQEVDWDVLRARAVEAMGHAYAPYSRYRVGVAGLVDDGRVVVGCNVENAAYGVALCAECGMVSQLHVTGGGRLTHVLCVDGSGEVLMPCGRCRQLLWENGGPTCELMTSRGVRTMDEVLPDAFGADDLA